ncbi:MAG: hypothetical protein ACT6QU_02330 [Aliihoeflea sp.]|uniref:hypothetical protein n=1 Tax=Aliihoeflea sp. TaxID=2608088 RepID=UPI004034A5DF
MFIFSYPLRYLALKNEARQRLIWRDAIPVVLLATALSLPFWLSPANFFGPSGFVDRFGAFAGVLTGFYIAALVGVASFSGALQGLDEVMQFGQVFVREDGEDRALTRREYVTAMFGYLSLLALSLSFSAILMVVSADVIRAWVPLWVGDISLSIFLVATSHMVVTTFHGLYYFIDRLYDAPATIPPKSDETE